MATHCNTLQHTATHCNTLQHTATHCNTLQHTATHRHFFDVILVYTWNLHARMCACAYVHVFICVHVHWYMTVYVYVFICVEVHWCMTLMTGASMPASFSTSRLSLVNRGVVYAISHVRGGADCGYDWYDASFIRCNVSVFLRRSLYIYIGLFLTLRLVGCIIHSIHCLCILM